MVKHISRYCDPGLIVTESSYNGLSPSNDRCHFRGQLDKACLKSCGAFPSQRSTTAMPTIAIVGAGPGLGASIARTFGGHGFHVALIARHPEKLDALALQLAASGVTAAR